MVLSIYDLRNIGLKDPPRWWPSFSSTITLSSNSLNRIYHEGEYELREHKSKFPPQYGDNYNGAVLLYKILTIDGEMTREINKLFPPFARKYGEENLKILLEHPDYDDKFATKIEAILEGTYIKDFGLYWDLMKYAGRITNKRILELIQQRRRLINEWTK